MSKWNLEPTRATTWLLTNPQGLAWYLYDDQLTQARDVLADYLDGTWADRADWWIVPGRDKRSATIHHKTPSGRVRYWIMRHRDMRSMHALMDAELDAFELWRLAGSRG